MALASRTPTPDVARAFLKKLGELTQQKPCNMFHAQLGNISLISMCSVVS